MCNDFGNSVSSRGPKFGAAVGNNIQIAGMAELAPPLIDADPAKRPPLAA
jgi:hypothetical protein